MEIQIIKRETTGSGSDGRDCFCVLLSSECPLRGIGKSIMAQEKS